MHRFRTALVLPFVASLILLADEPATRLAYPADTHTRNEVRRLQAHFDSVDGELKRRSVAHLSNEQRAARARLVAWLRDYRQAATFPLNDGVAPRAVPIFRDARGVLCAMAHLIQRSGRGDIVDDIAASRNTAYIARLADDARLVVWIDSTGLTLDEAARIQPTYDPPASNQRRTTAGYAVASLAMSGTAILTAGVNAVSPSRMSGIFGIITGTVALLHGAARLHESDGTRPLALVNTAVGAVSLGLALRGFSVPEPSRRSLARREARLADMTLGPAMMQSLGGPRLGVAVHARF